MKWTVGPAMMDTAALLIVQLEPHLLGRTIIEWLQDPGRPKLISTVSFWEVSIKFGLGKLDLPATLDDFFAEWSSRGDVRVVPLDLEAVRQVADLPKYHRDPFDRVLACQALQQGAAVVSPDRAFDHYGVTRFW